MSSTQRVLVVEDDEDDFFLTERALRKFTSGRIFHVESGRAAIEYLGGTGLYANRSEFPLPDLLFLDLKMDHMNGHQVLQWVREHMPKEQVKIFVLTGSNEPRDRELVAASGAAAGYIVKPLSADHLEPIFNGQPGPGTAR